MKAVWDYQSVADQAFKLDTGKHGDDRTCLWSNLYKANGPDALNPKERNSSYSKAFKEQCTKWGFTKRPYNRIQYFQ